MNEFMDKKAISDQGRLQLYEASFLPHQDMFAAEEEMLKRAMQLKQRKVSAQLKLETVHRHMSSNNPVPDAYDRNDFFRAQETELYDELEKISQHLAQAEREAFFARKRQLRMSGNGCGSYPTYSSSQPTVASDSIRRRMKEANAEFQMLQDTKQKFLEGELRATSSLTSLSTSPERFRRKDSQGNTASRERRSFKAPLKAIGDFVDYHILSRFPGSGRKTRSADNIPRIESYPGLARNSNPCLNDTSASMQGRTTRKSADYCPRGERPVPPESPRMFRRSSSKKSKRPPSPEVTRIRGNEVDPKLMAEIEEFEKMAAQYIQKHTQKFPVM